MTVYNMKRSMNILGMETILEKIKNWKPNYKGMTLLYQKVNLFNAISAHQNIEMKLAA
jgi:ABC-type lipoprotein export system ATPase subunit